MDINTKQTKTNRAPKFPIILLGKSEIAGRFVPTAHGEFSTVGDAEKAGRTLLKATPWVVGREAGYVNEDFETQYDHLSRPASSKRGYEE